MVHRFATRSGGPILNVVALRRPEYLVRLTTQTKVVVDERLLARPFKFVTARAHVIAVIMLKGTLVIHGRKRLRIAAGEAALLSVRDMHRARFESAAYLDLEWPAPSRAASMRPKGLGRVDLARAQQLAAALDASTSDQRRALALAFGLFQSIGVSVGALVDTRLVGPTEHDLRLARAVEDQFSRLADQATSTHLAEAAGLSSRQLQRTVRNFSVRYGINAGNWRDMRNRWRVQLAAILLSMPSLTVAEVAAEVGYASHNALARAFSKAGLPAPSEVRRALSRVADPAPGGVR